MAVKSDMPKRKMTFSIPVRWIEFLNAQSRERNISKSVLVTLALESYCGSENKKLKGESL